MKSHISTTIDRDLIAKVDRYRRSVRRSRSQVIELAVERFLRAEQALDDTIVTSEARFAGNFCREDTYER
jgi:predicted transcriptional regulator